MCVLVYNFPLFTSIELIEHIEKIEKIEGYAALLFDQFALKGTRHKNRIEGYAPLFGTAIIFRWFE